jgi:hypothetical protein
MAVLTYGAQVTLEWSNGVSDKCALYAVKNVNSGDTINLGPDFSLCDLAFMLVITPTQGTALPGVAGTTVTMPGGLSGVAGYILVYGESD